jgi:hypothetical protein
MPEDLAEFIADFEEHGAVQLMGRRISVLALNAR